MILLAKKFIFLSSFHNYIFLHSLCAFLTLTLWFPRSISFLFTFLMIMIMSYTFGICKESYNHTFLSLLHLLPLFLYVFYSSCHSLCVFIKSFDIYIMFWFITYFVWTSNNDAFTHSILQMTSIKVKKFLKVDKRLIKRFNFKGCRQKISDPEKCRKTEKFGNL